MSQLLSATAFGLLVGAQFLAVIAVHRLKQDARSSADTLEAPGLSDQDLHILAERLQVFSAGQQARGWSGLN